MTFNANGYGTITVFDASLIQKKIAGVELQQFNELAADVDGDGYITVFDASYIQRFLAGYHDPLDIGKPF